MEHRILRIESNGFTKTAGTEFQVEPVDPDQAAIEPLLSLGTVRGYRAMVATEVVVICHSVKWPGSALQAIRLSRTWG